MQRSGTCARLMGMGPAGRNGWRRVVVLAAFLAFTGCGGDPRTDGPVDVAQPCVVTASFSTSTASAPAETIAFAVDTDDGGHDIFTMQPDGSKVTRLTNDRTVDSGPAWAPDKTSILWERGGPGTFDGDVFRMNPDGTDRERLTCSRTSAGGARYATDKRSIVFSQTFRGGVSSLRSNIYTMSPDGTGQRALTNDRYVNHQPSYSPDGRHIVFASERPEGYDLWLMRADGSGARRLTRMPGDEHSPDWSPDGSEIVFVRRPGEFEESIMVISRDGSNKRVLRRAPVFYTSPRWSSDGSRILFIAGGLFTMAADGTDLVRVTDDGGDYLWADW